MTTIHAPTKGFASYSAKKRQQQESESVPGYYIALLSGTLKPGTDLLSCCCRFGGVKCG